MSKLNCICGNQISDVMCPNQYTGVIITSEEIDAFEGCEDIVRDGRDVWECPKCGRLAVSYPDKITSFVKWYKPEDSQCGNLMKFKEREKGECHEHI